MKNAQRLLLSIALSVSLVVGGGALQVTTAHAASKVGVAHKPRSKTARRKYKRRKMFGFVRALIEDGALAEADLVSLQGLKHKIGACWKAARKAKKSGRRACRVLRATFVKTQKATYEKAKAEGVKNPRLAAKLDRFLNWLNNTHRRIKGKLARKK